MTRPLHKSDMSGTTAHRTDSTWTQVRGKQLGAYSGRASETADHLDANICHHGTVNECVLD